MDWDTYVADPDAPDSRSALKFTADTIFATLLSHGPSGVDFSHLTQANGKHLALALRCSSSWKDKIPSWDLGLELAKQALTEQGHDPNDALFGMI